MDTQRTRLMEYAGRLADALSVAPEHVLNVDSPTMLLSREDLHKKLDHVLDTIILMRRKPNPLTRNQA